MHLLLTLGWVAQMTLGMSGSTRSNCWNKMVHIVSLQITFARLLINMMLKFGIDCRLIVFDDTSALHSRNFWSIVVRLIYHCWLIWLLKGDLCSLFEWVRLLGCRIGNGARSGCAVNRKNAWMAWIIWNAFWCSLMCLTINSCLSLWLMLVVAKAWPFNSSSKIAILSTIPLSLNLGLTRHVFQIGAIDSIRLRVISRNAWIRIMRKLTGAIGSICIWKIFLKSLFKQ